MRITNCLAMSALAVLAMPTPAILAEPVPDQAYGVWSVGNCIGDSLTFLVNSNSAILIENQEGTAKVGVGAAEWAAGSIILTLEGEDNEIILPQLDNLRRCESLPGIMPVLYAEAIAVFGRLDELIAACGGESGITALCTAVAFDLVDITGDGKFSKAEISRAIRAIGFFIGYFVVAENRQTAFVPLGELAFAQVAAAALGPFVATNLIDSYDFGGDGFLSLAELMQDRSPEKGFEGAIASVSSGMAPETLAPVMKSITGIIGMLK